MSFFRLILQLNFHFKKITGMNKLLVFVGVLTISAACSTSYKTIGYKYQNHSINVLTDSVNDPVFSEILLPYKNELGSEMSEIISYSDTSLIDFRPESLLSNFVTDLILNYARNFTSVNQPGIEVQFSLINHGGLRTSLSKGEITKGDIFELMPFENELVLLKLTGSQVSELAHHIASRDGEGVSGISFGMRSGRAESIAIQNRPLDMDSTYWMVTNDYIANGGDGMIILTTASQRVITGEKIRDVIINYLKELKVNGLKVSVKTDRRIYRVE